MNEKDSIEGELRNLLSVDPSPGFQDRVRAHAYRQPKAFSWNFRWAIAAAAVVATIVAAVLVFRPQRAPNTDVAVTVSRSADLPPALEPSPQPELTSTHHRGAKPAKAEPQLIIAAGEASAMRRLFSGEITELPPMFQPEVKQFQTPETVIEPLPPPAPVTIDPIESLVPAGQ
jgi:hypothetical protein